jgi:hypothetical protein
MAAETVELAAPPAGWAPRRGEWVVVQGHPPVRGKVLHVFGTGQAQVVFAFGREGLYHVSHLRPLETNETEED